MYGIVESSSFKCALATTGKMYPDEAPRAFNSANVCDQHTDHAQSVSLAVIQQMTTVLDNKEDLAG